MLAVAPHRLKTGAVTRNELRRQKAARVEHALTPWLAAEEVLGLHMGNECVRMDRHIQDLTRKQLQEGKTRMCLY